MKILLVSFTVLSSLLMVGLILLQQGKGSGLGSAFGGGAQGGLWGQSGRSNFLSRTTAILATVFFLSSLTLSLFLGEGRDSKVEEILGNSAVPAIERQSDKSDEDAPTPTPE